MSNRLGEAIKEKRKCKGLTQIDVANAVGLTQNALSNIERGKSVPHSKTLLKICEVLETPIELLYLKAIDTDRLTPEGREMFSVGVDVIERSLKFKK